MAEWQDADTLGLWLGVVLLVMLLLVGAMLVFTRIYLQRKVKDAQRIANMEVDHQKALLRDSIHVQEKERERIARDIHDELISGLNIMVLLNNTDQEKAAELLQTSIQTARRISHDLSPPLLEQQSFPELVAQLLDHFKKEYEVNYQLKSEDNIDLPVSIKLQLMRIVQEVLNNIIKHAKTQKIDLLLNIQQDQLQLEMHDHGIGFNTESKKGGLGLRNIEMRTQLLNGTLELTSIPGKGTSYFFSFPIKEVT